MRYVFIVFFSIVPAFFVLSYARVTYDAAQKCEKQMAQILQVDRNSSENKNFDERFIDGGASTIIFPISITEGKYLYDLYISRFGGPYKPYMSVERMNDGISLQAYNTKNERYFESAWFDRCGALFLDSYRQLKNKEKRQIETFGTQEQH